MTFNVGWVGSSMVDKIDPGYAIYQTHSPSYFVDYGVHGKLGPLRISGGMENTFMRTDAINPIGGFLPYHDTYWIEAEFEFTDRISLIGRHQCEHSVKVNGYDNPEEWQYDAAEDRIYLSVQIGGEK